MFIPFFLALRQAGLPVSLNEHLTLLALLRSDVMQDHGGPSLVQFHSLARLCLVKDETHFDRFDRVFAQQIQGLQAPSQGLVNLPEDWLRREFERVLSEDERAQLQRLDWDELMATWAQRLREQTARHQGGNRWIGTGGTSPFGAHGDHPQGVRIGQASNRRFSAVKVWDRREFRDLDEQAGMSPRNVQVALRRLRRFARQGPASELDIEPTISHTAARAGLLDLRFRPPRHNQVKVLLLMDVGGSMDAHIAQAEGLFRAARHEFKHLEFFYFHNCVYDAVWRHNRRRHTETLATWDLIRTFNRDYKLLLVGDATMSPYEITQVGGSVEFHNPESGAVWMQRLLQAFPKHAWINPEPPERWPGRPSLQLMQQLLSGPMVPLSPQGLETAMRHLSR